MTVGQQQRNSRSIAFCILLDADFVLYLEQNLHHKTYTYKVFLLYEFFHEPVKNNKIICQA